MIDDVRVYNRELTAAEVGTLASCDGIRHILAMPEDKRTDGQKANWRPTIWKTWTSRTKN